MEFTTPTECYEVRYLDGQGNGLFATRDIEKGELIFREFPFVWNGFKAPVNLQSSFCYTCGSCIVDHSTKIGCEGQCQLQFCSEKCLQLTNTKGHKFICGCYKPNGLVNHFSRTNKTGHLALALQCYMRIAQTCTEVPVEPATNSSTEPSLLHHVARCAQIVLGGYHKDDFCRANHAVRTGRLTIPDMEMFETLIAPAYFATNLEEGLHLIRESFEALPLSMWAHKYSSSDSADSSVSGSVSSSEEQASHLREAFLHAGASGIFHGVYFRHVVGTFVVNNHHVHLQQSSEGSASGSGVQLLGTALYPTVSKMNHSCECNTTNSHSKTDVQLAVYATTAVARGQELTTSYLHRRPAHARPQSRRSRHKCMLQYLFTCTCPKCETERLTAQRARRATRGESSKIDDADSSDVSSEEESSSDEEEDVYGADQCY